MNEKDEIFIVITDENDEEIDRVRLLTLYYKDGILKSELSNEATKYFSPSEILEKTARIYETIEIINLSLNRYNYFAGN